MIEDYGTFLPPAMLLEQLDWLTLGRFVVDLRGTILELAGIVIVDVAQIGLRSLMRLGIILEEVRARSHLRVSLSS